MIAFLAQLPRAAIRGVISARRASGCPFGGIWMFLMRSGGRPPGWAAKQSRYVTSASRCR
jgi:hypothetical protein